MPTLRFTIFIFILLSGLSNCQNNNDKKVSPQYLEVYYEYTVDEAQSLSARIKYLNIILKAHKNAAIRKKVIDLLNKIKVVLSDENSSNSKALLSQLNNYLIQKNIQLTQNSKQKNSKEKFKKETLWFNDETERRSEDIKRLTNLPDWDTDVYGTWIFQTENIIEQYRFFKDTSFEYIKIISAGDIQNYEINDHIKELGRISLVRRGQFKSSVSQHILTLYYDDLQKEKEMIYIVDSQRLNLDGKDFFKKNRNE